LTLVTPYVLGTFEMRIEIGKVRAFARDGAIVASGRVTVRK
jgi:hypothetical protein